MTTVGVATNAHTYDVRVVWSGNLGRGTADYAAYSREHRIVVEGKPDLIGSSDPSFRGDPSLHNPEDLFVAAIAACHMLVYLGLCARSGIRVVSYEDAARGELLLEPSGGGRFREVVLSPVVSVAEGDDAELARRLHEIAHERCFIANSCSVPIRVAPTIGVVPAAEGSDRR